MRGRRFTGMALGAALAATMLVAPAGATDEDTVWKTDVWGHPFEPYAQIPEEIQAGSTGTWTQLQGATPTRCETIGTLYDSGGGGVTVDQLAYELSDKQYYNPTKAWAADPPTRHPAKAEVTTFPNGPTAQAECSSPTAGVSSATWGRYLSKEFSVGGASSDSSNKAVDKNLIVTESTNEVFGLQAGTLTIDKVMSWLKVEYRPTAEPVISYRIEISGITDGQKPSGVGASGVVLAGQGIAGKDLAKQFNSQVRSGEPAFKTLGKYGFRILEPRIGFSRSQRYVIEISALDGMFGPAARENEVGQGGGFRLAVSRSAGRYERNGVPGPHDGYAYLDDPTFGFY